MAGRSYSCAYPGINRRTSTWSGSGCRTSGPLPARFPRHELTDREIQVLRWISDGKSNQQIAEILGVALGTVRKHVENIFNKLGVDSRTAAAGIFLAENPPRSPLPERNRSCQSGSWREAQN